MKDELGDRIKQYEDKSRLMSGLPVFARLDGKNFHRWIKEFGADKPFDESLSNHFLNTTDHLAREFNAQMAYTQSDEITLTWYGNNVPFDGRVQKIVSIIASSCTEYFNYTENFWFPSMPALFDCRVFAVPLEEAADVLLWRELDAAKNSVSMAARSVYSHKQLQGKTSKEMQEMLFQKGINWNDYPDHFKRGTYFQRHTVIRKFLPMELDKLPPKHEARTNPDLMVERQEFRALNFRIAQLSNRLDVIYNGAEPSYFPK